jgi:hypothetical protein
MMSGGAKVDARRDGLSARGAGCVLALMALFFGGINLVLMLVWERYIGQLFILAGPAFTFGLWVMIVGQSRPPNAKLPLWWRTGAIACVVVGFAFGFYLANELEAPSAEQSLQLRRGRDPTEPTRGVR